MKQKLFFAVLTLTVAAAGCELVVDFDRTKIPQPSSDAATSDVVQPVVDSGTDAPSTTDASDAARDSASDADTDAGDGAADADTDAPI